MIQFGATLALAHNAWPFGAMPAGGVAQREPARGVVESHSADLQLVQRLASGDSEAWRQFVVDYQRLVLSRVSATARELNQLLDNADLEDLCADVFTELVAKDYAALRGFEGRCALSTWLSVVTRRICLRRLAAARREPSRPRGDAQPTLDAVTAGQSDPLGDLIRNENEHRLAAALADLPDKQRDLIRLAYIEGRSYREISEQLGIPSNSIGPTLQRVHQKLRERMNS